MRCLLLLGLATWHPHAASHPSHHDVQQPILSPQEEDSSSSYSVQTPPLDTDWTYEVGTDPWPQYPRPKLARSQWQSLNGIWTYANASSHDALDDPPFNRTLPQEVLVPFCLESGLSGIQGENTIYSWYKTTFTVPSTWDSDHRVIPNFGAVDYEATVFVNGYKATFHRGGFFSFAVDVTSYLKGGVEELVVFAFDPTDSDSYVVPVGKQTLSPEHIFYRPCSGIWQRVWLESAPKNHIANLNIDGDAHGVVNLTVVAVNGHASVVNVTIPTHVATAGSPITFKVPSVKPWSPDSPTLYDVTIKMGLDTVVSYIGFRAVTKAEVNGVQRIKLNENVIFPFGTLDQGYWPDALFTPPTYEAMTFDINTQAPWLQYAPQTRQNELGILIMQDMPSLPSSLKPNKAQYAEFERQLKLLVKQLRSYTSIFAWVIYNEGWGQPKSHKPDFDLTDTVRHLDPTRLVDSVSGWFDRGAGDFSDDHHYTRPRCGTPEHYIDATGFDPSRIGFEGEFGGTGHNVSAEHLWKVKKAIDGISETYEMWDTLETWNARGHFLLSELLFQVQVYSCAGAVWTETTDVEGELNGMMTYDRRILRPDVGKWKADVQALYDASDCRSSQRS
ncbi:glycoside hydrolase family 2 protein [Periconia macrospinosa]|uniref:Glycoside hydrolase family 2 protein n=1 Tax=Periconia macrospinosa TaxID=97972 RepID=A0A2V1D191_9PLEO|nr:glycoside hydrolase family 2 protein [Periconia macrospinosa]